MSEEAQSLDGEMARRVSVLSARKLAVICALFWGAIGAMLFTEWREERDARRVETALRLATAANECARAIDLSALTGAPTSGALQRCRPEGASAVYHADVEGRILASEGRTDLAPVTPLDLGALSLTRGGAVDLPGDRKTPQVHAAWRPLNGDDAVLVAAPAADILQRSPAWFALAMIFAAVGLVLASLVAAFAYQSRAAYQAADAIDALARTKSAMAAGRACAWTFDPAKRAVILARSLLEPMGFGARDRAFTLQEISALVHAQDLRTTIAIFSGDGEEAAPTEATIRFRRPNGAWARVFIRAAQVNAAGVRSGVAFDMNGGARTGTAAAVADTRLRDAIESIPEAFVLWDAQGRLAAFNKRFAAIFRLDRKALHTGMTVSEVANAAGVGGDLVSQYFAADAPVDEQSVEVAIKGDRWLRIDRRRTAEGGLVCVATNVTDEKRRARA
ncbi:MAG: PAS-domain containing protein, partial [Pseudomonadota bacterium]